VARLRQVAGSDVGPTGDEMIGRLRGQLVEKRPTELLLDVGGIGYEALIPLSTFAKLPEVGDQVTLITHLHVREDLLQLYAFAAATERRLFRLLLTVSGIGPKLALAILSGLSVAQFQEAVTASDAERLQAIPGVGKRTAERLVVELRDRLSADDVSAQDAATAAALGCSGATLRDAVATLTTLGYSTAAAQRATRRALKELGHDPELEQLIRSALGVLND